MESLLGVVRGHIVDFCDEILATFEMMTKTETNQRNTIEGSSDVMYVFLDVHLKKILRLLV